MDLRLEAIESLLKHAQRELDDIEWENHKDPRIEDLCAQIKRYKEQLERGEFYEPKF